MRQIKLLVATLAWGLLMTTIVPAAAAAAEPNYDTTRQATESGDSKPGGAAIQPAAALNLPADYYIFGGKKADVTGDGIADEVYLVGRQAAAGMRSVKDLGIVVINGDDKSVRTFSLDKVGGFAPQLFLGDFSGDKVPDVYVQVASGGSGGWSYHHIITFNGAAPQEIFGEQENRTSNIAGKFIDGWRVELTDSASGETTVLDVSNRRQDYLRLGIYNADGKVIKETKTMTTPFGDLTPVDTDHDGTFALQGVQRISGAYHADSLADAATVLTYDGAGWQARSVITALASAATATAADSPVQPWAYLWPGA